MHQTFWFRLNVPKNQDAEEVQESAVATFDDYINQYGDENNWHQVEMLLLQDGTVFQLCKADDYRGRAGCAEHFLALPQEERWKKALHAAMVAVALDLGIGGSSSVWFGQPDYATKQVLEQTVEQVQVAIEKEVPRKIARLYQDLVDGIALDSWPGQGDYLRRTMTRTFELYHGAVFKPFAEPESPYDYPCFDLSSDETGDRQAALLAVDIHT